MALEYSMEQATGLFTQGFGGFKDIFPTENYVAGKERLSQMSQAEAFDVNAKAANSLLIAKIHGIDPQEVHDNYEAYATNMGLSGVLTADYDAFRNFFLGGDSAFNPTEVGQLEGVINSLKIGGKKVKRAGLSVIRVGEELKQENIQSQIDYHQGMIDDANRIMGEGKRSTEVFIRPHLEALGELQSQMAQVDPKEALQAKAGRMAEIASIGEEIKSIPLAKGYRKFQQAEGWVDTLLAFGSNPFEVTANILAESAPQAFVQIPATALGGPGGGAMVSYISEYNAEFFEALSDAGVDSSNPDQLLAAYQNEEVYKSADERARAKASFVAGADLISAGLAGRFKPLGEFFQQTATEAAGEVGGQLAATGDVEFKEVFSEVIGSAAMGGFESRKAVGEVFADVRSDMFKRLTRSKKGQPLNKEAIRVKLKDVTEQEMSQMTELEQEVVQETLDGDDKSGTFIERTNILENKREEIRLAEIQKSVPEIAEAKEAVLMLEQGIEPVKLPKQPETDIPHEGVEVRPGDPRDEGVDTSDLKVQETERERRIKDVNTAKLKMKAAVKAVRSKLNERIDALKQELGDVKRAKKEELLDQRASNVEATKQLVEMVKSLPPEFRRKFNLSEFQSLATKATVDAQLSFLGKMDAKIDQIFEKNTRKLLLSKIDKEVASVEKAKAAAELGASGKKFKYGAETTRYLELAGLGSGEARVAAQEKYQKLVEKVESAPEESPYEWTDEDFDTAREALVPDLANRKNLDSGQLSLYLDNLKSVKSDGLTKWHAKEKARKGRLDGEANKIGNKIAARNSKRKTNRLSPDDVAYERGLKSIANSLNKNLLDIRSVNAILTGEQAGPLKRLVIDKIADGVSESINQHRKYTDFIKETAERYDVNLFKSGATPLPNVNIGDKQLSMYEAMFVYGHSQNDIGMEHLENTVFNGQKLKPHIDAIVDNLPAKYQKFVDKLIEHNDNVMYPRLNELYIEMYGVPMPKESRYLPISNLSHKTAFDVAMSDNPAFMRMHLNFMKSRTGGAKGFKSLDLIGSLEFNNSSAEHAIALHSVLQDAKQILDNKELQAEMGKADEWAVKYLKDYIKAVALGEIQHPKNSFVQLLRTLRNNVRTYWLALNPGSWMKTQAPMFSAAQEIGMGHMAAAASSHFSRSNWNIAREKSKFMQSRPHTNRIERAELASRQFEASKLGKVGSVVSTAKSLNNWTQDHAYIVYDPLDRAATSTVWVAKYNEQMNKHGIEAKAVRSADDVVKKHFPSGRIDELPPIFQDSGLLKEFTIFTADMNRMYNLGYTNTQLKSARVQRAFMFAFYSMFLSSAYLAMTDMGQDEFKELMGVRDAPDSSGAQFLKDFARYNATQAVGGVPLVGKIVEAGVLSATGEKRMSRLMAAQTPISLYPAAQAMKGNYFEAGASATGIPAANILIPMIKDFMESDSDGGDKLKKAGVRQLR